jgi:hypothetical protein
VHEELSRNGYMKFLDNCAIHTVEEGEIEEAEIVANLHVLFDSNWHWQLRKLEEYKFLIRSPPPKKLVDTLISNITYFKMRKAGCWFLLKHGLGILRLLMC